MTGTNRGAKGRGKMKKHGRRKRLKGAPTFAVFLSVLICGCGQSYANDRPIDLNALLKDTQLLSQNPKVMRMTWWVPEEFWWASFANDPNITPEQSEEIISVLRPYLIVVGVNAAIGTFAGMTFMPKEVLRDTIEVIDANGVRYSPFTDEEVDPDAVNFLSMMGPVMKNMAGPMGENMHFFLFPKEGKDGTQIADPFSESFFKVRIAGEEFTFRLPLGSLLPPKLCPTDGEELSGAWKFCPRHGDKLE